MITEIDKLRASFEKWFGGDVARSGETYRQFATMAAWTTWKGAAETLNADLRQELADTKRVLADTIAEVGRLREQLANSQEREGVHSAMRQELHSLALKTTGNLIDRVNALTAQRDELAAFTRLVAAMKTEEEFGEEMPDRDDWVITLSELISSARAALAKLGEEGGK